VVSLFFGCLCEDEIRRRQQILFLDRFLCRNLGPYDDPLGVLAATRTRRQELAPGKGPNELALGTAVRAEYGIDITCLWHMPSPLSWRRRIT